MKREARKSTQRTPDIHELEDGLQIDQNDLAEACVQQPDLFYRVAKQLALFMSQRDAAAQAVKEEEAVADQRIRDEATGAKVTEKEIESLKLRDESVISARQELLEFTAAVGRWSALKEAFQQRSYVLKDLVNLHVTSHYGSMDGSGSIKAEQADYARKVNSERRQRS